MNDANNTWYSPMTIAFTCDGNSIFTYTFQRFIDVKNFMQGYKCLPPVVWAAMLAIGAAGWLINQ
jgi:hypothetical protein